ncbi:hypothetical protein H0264_25370 [Nocardia huaxiensis]|uniref:ADP ribosyltransferase domain-containing protein n=1 Tax=Nocardia huaxiensis TaxID=2755382 RepID=A0A7D6VC00_9NOCA|nr:ADP-ribosyltransferase [Nocardia huaxiensis]QLY28655.1 hypothetical protein H0264_25370 [Nocardia huaxiensis]
MVDEGDEYGFDAIPLAETALAGQRADRLTDSEADVIRSYTYNSHDAINKALWGEIAMTPAIERRIRLIRSGLAKYPLESAVRVTREVEASEYDIYDADSAYALIDEDIIHHGFLSTSPRSPRRKKSW